MNRQTSGPGKLLVSRRQGNPRHVVVVRGVEVAELGKEYSRVQISHTL